jgi:hypothetical protein
MYLRRWMTLFPIFADPKINQMAKSWLSSSNTSLAMITVFAKIRQNRRHDHVFTSTFLSTSEITSAKEIRIYRDNIDFSNFYLR